MLYQSYREKVQKRAAFFAKLKKLRWLFIAIAIFLVMAAAGLMSVSGLVYDISDCPQTVLYGEIPSYRAGAVFNKTHLEFAETNSDEWSQNPRICAGEYKVRAVSETVAGTPRYGKVKTFTVLPKPVEVYADENGFVYGDAPVFTGAAVYGDKFICTEYELYYSEKGFATVIPSVGSVRAVDENGADVSSSYIFTPAEKSVAVLKRKITVNVADITKTYSGKAVSSDEYSLDPETPLAAGDGIAATFTVSVTDAGRYRNMPQITLFHGSEDVTDMYEPEINGGWITINKKPLKLTSKGAYKIYDGDPLSNPKYAINEGYSEVCGHSLAVKEARAVTDAGKYENIIKFSVYDAQNNDVTANYDIVCGGGTLEIAPRPVTVSPEFTDRIYDGTTVASVGVEVAKNSPYPLSSGHNAVATVNLSSADIGISAAEITSVTVVDAHGKPVNGKNYVFTYVCGEVNTLRRSVTLRPVTSDKVYDGTCYYTVSATADESSRYALVAGHIAAAQIITAQVDVGTGADKIISARVFDGENEVTENYWLTYLDGVIRVVPRPVTVTTADGEWTYDGNGHFEEGASCADLVSGHRLSVTAHTEIINAGTLENKLTVDILSGGKSVAYNYTVSYKNGALKVKKRPVTIVAGSREKSYDGEQLVCYSYGVSEDTPLVGNHRAIASTYGSQTDAGESPNRIAEDSVRIYTGGTTATDVTANYAVSYAEGVLKVTPRRTFVTTVAAVKQYDGKPLVSYDVSGNFIFGHTATAQTTGSRTEVGVSENGIVEGTVKITDGLRDVTANYEITGYVAGSLTVQYPWTFAYSTYGAEKIYDGKPLTADGYKITADAPEGFTAKITVNGSVTNAFSVYNTADVTFRDASGKDVTHLVHVKASLGVLTVNPRPVSVITNSREWEYDGKFHSDNGFKIVEDSEYKLLENHTATSEFSAYILNVGEKPNSMTIVVRDGSGRIVSENYKFIFDYGTLKITGEDGSGSGSGGGNGGVELDKDGNIGLPNGGSGGGNGDSDTVPVKIYSETSGDVYLRLLSYGEYNGGKWLPSPDYTGRVDGKYGMTYITGNALKNSGYPLSHMILENRSKDYVLPYYVSADSDASAYDVQTGDVYYQGVTSAPYEVDYYAYDYLQDPGVYVGEQFYAAEQNYRAFVYSKYLAVPAGTRAYMQSVISANGWKSSTYGIVGEVASYVQNAARYNAQYDRNLDNQPDIAVSFLRDYKEGVCQHYATAATLLYRTLGIPARYAIGYAASTVAGKWVDVTGDSAHAWVEVYIDGAGWIQIEVTGGGPGGTGGSGSGGNGVETLPSGLVLKPADAAKPYDGTPLTATALEMTYDLKWLLYCGYTYKCGFSGSQTAVGTSFGTVSGFELFDPEGKKVETVKYEYRTCALTVTAATTPVITVHPYGVTKIYNGTGVYYGFSDYYYTGLPRGYSLNIYYTSIGLDGAGMISREALQSLDVRVRDGSGRDVTGGCFILYDTADMLTVFKRQITVCAASAQKIYDGKSLEDANYYISSGSLADGHGIVAEVSGSVTDIGTEKNRVTDVKIYDLQGRDVTENYNIKTVSGTLTVI